MSAQPVPKAFPPATAEPRSPNLLDRVRAACCVRHYSLRTEDAYVDWIKRFILFNNKCHPLEMGTAQINAFLTQLAVDGHVSASTQNQAFSALPRAHAPRWRVSLAEAFGGREPAPLWCAFLL